MDCSGRGARGGQRGAARRAGATGADSPRSGQAVEAVQLSVIVTDSEGNPVSGLTADDFEVLEDRVSRPITTFAAVDIPIERVERSVAAVRRAQQRAAARAPVCHRARSDAAGQRSPLRTRALPPAVHRKSLRAERYGGGDPDDRRSPRLGPGFHEQSASAVERHRQVRRRHAWWLCARLREKNFIGDFKALMQFMSTLRGGRKAVIFVSESIPVDAYDVVDRGRARFGGLFSQVDTDWVDALSFATRNNIAVYPVDPRGLTTGVTGAGIVRRQRPRRPLDMGGLAEVTGGFSLVGSNNYAGGLRASGTREQHATTCSPSIPASSSAMAATSVSRFA